MIRSMTGFGKAEADFQSKKISVEIKSLNSKQLDLTLKLPFDLRSLEYAIRNQIAPKLQRGKIELNVSFADVDLLQLTAIDTEVVKAYLSQIKMLENTLQLEKTQDLMSLVLKLPGVFKTPDQLTDPMVYAELLQKLVEQAFEDFETFRIQEGQVLKSDLLLRIDVILNLLNQIEPFDENRKNTIKQRLNKTLSENFEEKRYDENRFEQELIYYLEKLDITEEKVRLRQHCAYFTQTIDEDNAGKKLGFITQEIGREINTLGSKANEANVQRIVVQMKDELEKIKEQLFNIL